METVETKETDKISDGAYRIKIKTRSKTEVESF